MDMGMIYAGDNFSSPEAFEKVQNALRDSLGQIVMVVKPEVSGSYRGGDESYDNYLDNHKFGVLQSPPIFKGQFEGISLPMESHYTGFELGKDYALREDGDIKFHCSNPGSLEVIAGNVRPTGSGVKIYTTGDAIEGYFGFNMVDYIRFAGVLGADVSDEMMNKYAEQIREQKEDVKGTLVRLIAKGVLNSGLGDVDEIDLRRNYAMAHDWGIGDEASPVNLGNGVSVNVGEYLDSLATN